MTLTEFLLARIHDDEAAAWATPPLDGWEKPNRYGMRFLSYESDHSSADTDFVSRFDPARVLAECAAKRGLVRLAQEQPETFAEVLRWLGEPYADHPDYKPEWRA